MHLFFECSSSVTRWYILGVQWPTQGTIFQMIIRMKEQLRIPFFMELFLIAAWCIWKERNDFIFNGRIPSVSSWKVAFKKEVLDHFCRIKPSLYQFVRSWLDHV